MKQVLLFLFISINLFAQNFNGFNPLPTPAEQKLTGKINGVAPPNNGISLSLQNAHTSEVISVNLSKNGNYALTTSSDNTIKLWETGFKKILHSFAADGVPITQAFFAENDSFVFMGGSNTNLFKYTLHNHKLDAIPYKIVGKFIQGIQKNKNTWWILSSKQLIELSLTGDQYAIKVIYTEVKPPYVPPAKNSSSALFKSPNPLPPPDIDLIGMDQASIGNITINRSNGSKCNVSSDGVITESSIGKTKVIISLKKENVARNYNNYTFVGEKSVVFIYLNGQRYDKVFCNRIEHSVKSILALDNNTFVWINDGGEITIYNAQNKKVVYRKVFKEYSFKSMAYDDVHSTLYIGDKDGGLSTFEPKTLTFKPLKLIYSGIEDVTYDFKSSNIAWADNQGFVNTMEFESGRFKTKRLKLDNYEITAVKYSPQTNKLLAAGFENKLYEISIGDSLTINRKIKIKKRPAVRNIGFVLSKIVNKPIRHRIQVTEINLFKNDSVVNCDMVNNKPFFLLRSIYQVMLFPTKSAHFNATNYTKCGRPYKKTSRMSFGSPASGYVSYPFKTFKYRFITTEGSEQLINKTISAHNGLLSGMKICENINLTVTSGRDGSLQLWKENAGKPNRICTIYPGNAGEKLIVNEQNFYWGTQDILNKVGFNFNANYYFPDQFDFIYNRPDLVLKSIDSLKYNELIKTFQNAYKKRLKKAGLTENNIALNVDSLPNLEIVQLNQDSTQITFSLTIIANGANVKRINVWNNGVPVFGTNGIAPTKNNEKRTLSIPINSGTNKIQFSALDKSGNESFRNTFIIKGAEIVTKPNLYFVGLGCSEYTQQQYNLTYAAKDINDLNTALKTSGKFSKVNSLLLINKDLSRESVAGIKQFLMQSKPNDQVILFYAGHGVLDKNYNYYLTPSNTDFLAPETTAIPYEWIEAQLDSIPAYRKLLLIDACHSGELDKDDLLAYTSAQANNNKDIKFRKVGSTQYTYSSNTAFELSKELFMDLRRGTGTTVISSSGGLEFAMEGKDWNNGLFTYCLLNGVKTKKADLNGDKSISVSEIKKYVQEKVKVMSKGLQTPVTRNENIEIDYLLW
jgi:WD40 repeat protein